LDLTSPGGELFMHKDAIEIIKTAKDVGFKHIGTFLNGILIHRFSAEDLLTSGIDALLISFPGFTADIYQEIFGVMKFDEFRKSIVELLETHKKINSEVFIIFEPRTYLTLKKIKESVFYQRFCFPIYQ
jgi:MoaA/NifB/PqqE/SkfB family radical SAM enzyme